MSVNMQDWTLFKKDHKADIHKIFSKPNEGDYVHYLNIYNAYNAQKDIILAHTKEKYEISSIKFSHENVIMLRIMISQIIEDINQIIPNI